MVKGTHLAGVQELEEPIGFLNMEAADNKWTALVDGIAYEQAMNTPMLAASIAGGSTEIRAWRAGLGGNEKIQMTWTAMGGRPVTLCKDPQGYEVHVSPLGMGAFHLVAVSKRPELLTCITEEAVWQNLLKRTTTPICREWMPGMLVSLAHRSLLKPAVAHGRMQPGLLSINTEALDKLVSHGLKNALYRIAV